jgi:glycosyltransferase involved in cell wall biosynthesis
MSGSSPIRVGFALAPGDWLGGRNYLRNLFLAIQALPDRPITPVIFMGRQQPDVSGDFLGVEIVRTSIMDRKSGAWVIRKAIGRILPEDILLQKVLRRHAVTVVSHSYHLGFDPGPESGVKSIGWIADFQHVRMPEFFTPEQRLSRDREFRMLCARCDKVIVSSECAREDLRVILPEYGQKAELLQFVASPTPLVDAASLVELRRVYGFDGPYFLLPNQFWAHKNHRVVISALHELTKKGKPVVVLATGATKDHRNPSLFQELMRYAADCGVSDYFRVLGQIPFEHLAGLMRHTVAFINPSLFEGWSTSVEEAKSTGKQIVLSDLPVHREQAPDRSFYFPAHDAGALARAMTAAYEGFDEQSDNQMQDAARARFPERQRAFGETFRQIVENVGVHDGLSKS